MEFKTKSVEEIAKLTTEEQTQYFADKAEHQKAEMIKSFDAKIEEQTKGFLSKNEADKLKSDFSAQIKDMPIEELNKYNETIKGLRNEIKTVEDLAKEIKGIVKTQGETMRKMEGANAIPEVRKNADRRTHIQELIKQSLSSKEFESFKGRGFVGASNKMVLGQEGNKVQLKTLGDNGQGVLVEKATISTTSHTGNVLISEVSDIVRDDAPTRVSHVRDLLNVSMTNQAQVVAGQVYDFTDALTLGAVMLSENGQAPESVFKSKENTWGLKRIANSMRLSKREIAVNGLDWVMDKVLAKLPDATLYVEDVQLLFGDGLGENVLGLSKGAQAFDLSPNTYAATAIASVATYNGGAQALITFAAAHGLKNGDDLTLASATATGYNKTHTAVEVINTKQAIIDFAYVAEADTSAWTGSSKSPFSNEIDNAQEYDVLAVADANLEAGEYTCTGHVIHPSTATKLGLLKDSQGNYLNLSKDANGRVTGVNGKPLAVTTAMPYGKFLSGDFSRNGVELREFTPLNIQFAEDVASVQKNEIVIVIQEEIIFPIYNPYWFTFGKFSTAKTQLETP
ncbi:major capsid protein [Polaribacter phage Danklef_4]|nr:major capsid protein [Polaribacter phage Danklef_2]QQV90772.1 major capsid protein [Polaribacter phage Danklef_4]